MGRFMKYLILALACLSCPLFGDKVQNSNRPVQSQVECPERISMDVVYISQNDDKSCATTSVAMALSYYENLKDAPLDKETVWNISGSDGNTVRQNGNDMEGLKRIAIHYGYESEYIENMDISNIELLLYKGIPVMLNITTISPATHAILVTGYDKSKRILYINDPSDRQRRILEYSDLEARWLASLSAPKGMSHRSGFVIYPKKHSLNNN